MTKILIRKEVTTMQTVGGGAKPTIRDLGRAAFGGIGSRAYKEGETRSGFGLPAHGSVGVGGRLAGLAGLAGKGAAAVATGFQTANALQGGNVGAPLQAGQVYQGLDPTGGTMSSAIQGHTQTKPVGVTPVPLPAPVAVAQTPTINPANPGGLIPHQSPPGTVGTLMPATQASATPLPTPLPTPIRPAIQPQSPTASFAGNVGQAMTTQQQIAPFANDVAGAVNNPQQQNQQTQEEIDAAHAAQQAQQYPQSTLQLSFADEVINRLGPDRIFKMTPHQLGTLSAYMYLKLR